MNSMAQATADQMIDQLLHRFLEIVMKIPFEPWDNIGQEFLGMILAYTLLLAYGKILSTICKTLINGVRKLFGFLLRNRNANTITA